MTKTELAKVNAKLAKAVNSRVYYTGNVLCLPKGAKIVVRHTRVKPLTLKTLCN